MSFGVLMKGFNSLYFRRYSDFFNEFLPQILLLLLIFGYMDTLIITKWLTDYTGQESLAPSIISTMIAIPLGGGSIKGKPFFVSEDVNAKLS